MRICAALALVAVLAGCDERRNPGYQGWVEADMIFVSPDESGRVIKLNVREGDEVKVGMPLYSVDDDLQQRRPQPEQGHARQRAADAMTAPPR